jgi:hypothetical protein
MSVINQKIFNPYTISPVNRVSRSVPAGYRIYRYLFPVSCFLSLFSGKTGCVYYFYIFPYIIQEVWTAVRIAGVTPYLSALKFGQNELPRWNLIICT